MTDSTFTSNRAPVGGAINNYVGNLTVTGSTFTANSAINGGAINNNSGTLALNLSVVSGNSASSSGPNILGAINSGSGNVVGGNAMLGILSNNGGPVQTIPLLPGSPAIDILACPAGLTADARGVPRPQGANCDAGAYEVVSASPQTYTVTRGGRRERRELHHGGERRLHAAAGGEPVEPDHGHRHEHDHLCHRHQRNGDDATERDRPHAQRDDHGQWRGEHEDHLHERHERRPHD